MARFLTLVIVLLCARTIFAEAAADISSPLLAERLYRINPRVDYYFTPSKAPNILTALPKDIGQYFSQTFRDRNVPAICNMALATAILVGYDQQITDASKHVGRHLHIAPTNEQTPVIKWRMKIGRNSFPLNIQAPTDLSSAMYFLGDGITHFTTAAAFGTYGLLAHDYRAQQTCVQSVEAIFATGAVVQVLKHITGRETANATTANGGVWRLFPNQKKYAAYVPNYDAFPTGHLATAMATVTVIADNYPEHKYIKPIGYTLIGICGYSMLNNGVHWASDYPLGIAIGYSFAKIVTSRGRVVLKNPESKKSDGKLSLRERMQIAPALMPNNSAGVGLMVRLD